jgi:hypothetical protein
MNISPSQQKLFWRKWAAVKSKHGWTTDQAETERKALLTRAGSIPSPTLIPIKGFSRVLNELAALNDDLAGMLKAQANERRVLEYKIEELGIAISGGILGTRRSSYTAALMIDRYGHADTDRLSLEELKQLVFTLSARLSAKRKTISPQEATQEHHSENVPF